MRRLLLLALVLLWATPAMATPRVAVLYFNNTDTSSTKLDMLRLGLAEMMITDLSNNPELTVVERSRLNEILAELELQKTDQVDPGKAVEIGKLLGAERMVLGTYFEFLGKLTLIANVVEVQTGTTIGGHKVQGETAEFTALLDEVTGRITPVLALGRAAPEPTPATKPAPSEKGKTGKVRSKPDPAPGARPDPASASSRDDERALAEAVDDEAPAGDSLGAAMAFSEGLDYLDRKDLKRAREALRRAVDLDPALDLAKAELAKIEI